MNPNLYLISLSILGLSMLSCAQPERVEQKNSKNNYEEAFVKAFGNYSKVNTWNTAGQFSLDIEPGADGIVKIYAPCNDGYRLVAHYSHAVSAFTSQFDAPVASRHFVVALGGELYYVESGGRVSSHSPSAADAKVSDEALRWILAVENDFDADAKGRRDAGSLDFDFNDLLINISSVATDGGVDITFAPLACGDNQPFYIHVRTDGEDKLLWQDYNDIFDDCEYHQWFGLKDHTTGVNTGTNAAGQIVSNAHIPTVEAITAAMSGCHIKLSPNWTLSNYSHITYNYKKEITDLWGIYITVGTYKGYDLIKKDTDYAVICAEGAGAAPRMLLFPDTGQTGEWRWPCEGNNIANCYPVFKDWLENPVQAQYIAWHEWLCSPGTTRERY